MNKERVWSMLAMKGVLVGCIENEANLNQVCKTHVPVPTVPRREAKAGGAGTHKRARQLIIREVRVALHWNTREGGVARGL